MKQTAHQRWILAAATIVYMLLLVIFYWKYVPLVAGYQMILAPILFFLTIYTAVDVRKGLLAFIFLFPLINNLPYFFKLYEPLPMAPSALILFLFFFLGWLLHRTFAAPDPSFDGVKLDEPIFTPLKLFAGLVIVSALITFWRYTNFFPLWRPRIYELVTNAYGTSAGGAIMSIVFYSLTYLTGIAFFMILVRAVRSEGFVRKAITVLGVSTLISLAFGLFQHFKAPTLGNNPISISVELINATFKDALSFGAYISMIVPLFLSLIPALKGKSRAIPALSILPAVFLLFYAGSKSALLSLAVVLCAQGLFALVVFIKRHRPPTKIIITISLILIFLASAATIFLFSEISPIPFLRKSTTFVRMDLFKHSLVSRLDNHWTIAGRIIKDYPLSGVGMGSFIIESSNFAKDFAPKYEIPESAESLLLQIGSELGIPGTFLFLWILWNLFTRAGYSYRVAPRSFSSRTLIPAAAAGIISFLFNTLSHSYIGSYEIHYAFWFLAALLFAATISRPPSGKFAAFPSRSFLFFARALVVLSGITLLWISTHSLSLKAQTQRYGLRQEFGFGPVEKNAEGIEFRWSGRFSGIPYKIESTRITVPLLASHPDISIRPVQLKIFIAPNLATKPTLIRNIIMKESRWEEIELFIPDSIRGPALFIFEVDRTWNPLKEGVSPDPRNLGIAMGKIKTSG